MKNLIVYRSLMGTCKSYADWLQEDIGGNVVKYNRINLPKLSAADNIILIGATYAGWMSMGGFIKKWENLLNQKKTFYVNVGMAPEDDPQTKRIWDTLPPQFLKKAKLYKIPGKMGGNGKETVKKANLAKIIRDIV